MARKSVTPQAQRLANELRRQRADARKAEATARKLEAEARKVSVDEEKARAEIAKLRAEESKLRNELGHYEQWLNVERVKAWGAWATVGAGLAAILAVLLNLVVFFRQDEQKTTEIVSSHIRDLASEHAGVRASAAIALRSYAADERHRNSVLSVLATALADERDVHVQQAFANVIVGFGSDAVSALSGIRSEISASISPRFAELSSLAAAVKATTVDYESARKTLSDDQVLPLKQRIDTATAKYQDELRVMNEH